MSWGFELFLNLGFSGAGVGGISKAPVRSACLGMLADIARPESNGEEQTVFSWRFSSDACKR